MRRRGETVKLDEIKGSPSIIWSKRLPVAKCGAAFYYEEREGHEEDERMNRLIPSSSGSLFVLFVSFVLRWRRWGSLGWGAPFGASPPCW